MINVYDELKTDLRMFASPEQVENIIDFLQESGLIDYDSLKEFYLYGDDDA